MIVKNKWSFSVVVFFSTDILDFVEVWDFIQGWALKHLSAENLPLVVMGRMGVVVLLEMGKEKIQELIGLRSCLKSCTEVSIIYIN